MNSLEEFYLQIVFPVLFQYFDTTQIILSSLEELHFYMIFQYFRNAPFGRLYIRGEQKGFLHFKLKKLTFKIFNIS